jgi:hypothetical protein
VAGRQVDVIMPMILENLWTDNDDALDMLLQRVQLEEKVDADRLLRRRTSVGTVATVDTAGDPHPLAFSGSAVEADKLAEEDIGVLAMHCLKNVFVVPNRPQIYTATGALIRFILEKVDQGHSVLTVGEHGRPDSGWAITIYNIISRWAPVQDRYSILVVAMDVLTRKMPRDAGLRQRLILVAIIGSLLRSDVNLIGLSVMDILLGLVRQMRRLFQSSHSPSRSGSVTDEKTDVETADQEPLSVQLLGRLEQCIGDLATHVYYADQISDMIVAILGRLKPTRSSSTTSTPQGEKLDNAEAGPGNSVADLADGHSNIDAYFSYKRGRVSGLRIIKAILLVASPKTRVNGNANLSRNRVPLHVWEGTNWLLLDPDGEVRKAYVDALVTWLERETAPSDLKAKEDLLLHHRSSLRGGRDLQSPSFTRRAVSNASNRERAPRTHRSQFLALLHLAIYDNALQFVDCDADIATLHVLLTKLVFRLGVNSVRYGIPMIYRLQEDVQDLELPISKARLAALCHGYFWALTEKFDFEASAAGRAIHNEIIRRQSKGFWVEGIKIPPPSLSQIGMPGEAGNDPSWDLEALEKEELLPFDDRATLVESISTSYEESGKSPPTSPAASPSRGMSHPILGSALTSGPAGDRDGSGDLELPSSFREQMLTDWSREGAVAALASEVKAESLNGSRPGTTGTRANRLTIHTTGTNGNGYATGSPHGSPRNLRPHSVNVPGDNQTSKLHRSSVRSGISTARSMTNKGGVASVNQLKLVLSGDLSQPQPGGFDDEQDDSGDSMVSYEYSPSEASYNTAAQAPEPAAAPEPEMPKRSASTSSRTRGPLSSHPLQEEDEYADDDVPPVPPLPNNQSILSAKGGSGNRPIGEDIAVQDHAHKQARRVPSARALHNPISRQSQVVQEPTAKAMDLQDLLLGIDSHSGEGSLGNVTKPPY